jgi:tRNA(Ile)-lysidine synthase
MSIQEENQQSLERKVSDFIREHQLVSAAKPLVVAVSGGPDSVCLFHILCGRQQELGVKLHVAHLNHQLRGAEADADAHYVAGLARRWAVPATIEPRDVRAYQAEHRLSLEEAAREVRYAFLAEVARAIGADRVAVGHTVDDHIETILMHLIRGTGSRGLRGLQPKISWQISGARLTIVRPLLSVSREETESYCQLHQLSPRLDSSNLGLSPLRNRIRHQLLPLLEGYNRRIAEALLRTAGIAGDDLAFLDGAVAEVWDSIVRKQKKAITLDKKGLLELAPALKRHLLRAAIEGLVGNIKDIEAHHIEEMMAILPKPAGKRLCLPGGLIFAVEYDRYVLSSGEAGLSPFPRLEGEFNLKIPGLTWLPGWQVTAAILNREQWAAEEIARSDFTAYFDFGKTGDSLTVRPRRRGDRFQPLGMDQSKKLGEFMIDARISQAWRGQVPLVCAPAQILWVVGYRIDERVKVTDNTRRILCLRLERQH